MDELTDLSLDEFLNQSAMRVPTPGGGSVTAAAGALGGALARMVVAYSVNKKTDPVVREAMDSAAVKLNRADQLLRALITRDAVAYAAMTALGKAMRDDPSQEPEYRQAVFDAVAVPMEVAAVASGALTTMDEIKETANRFLLSDLAIAALLADAAAQAARYTVLINIAELADSTRSDRLLGEIDTILKHCAARRRSVESFVHAALEPNGPPSR